MSEISRRMGVLLNEMYGERSNPAGGDKKLVRVVKGNYEFYFADAATAAEAVKLLNSYTTSPEQYRTEEVPYFSSLKAFKDSEYAKDKKAYWDDREARWASYAKK